MLWINLLVYTKMRTHKLSTWIKGITDHNNLAYFQSKIHPEIDPTYIQANETLHHLMTAGCYEKQNNNAQHDLVS